jgi:hypothetical protein
MRIEIFTINGFLIPNELLKHFKTDPFKTIYRRLWAKGIPAYKMGSVWRIARENVSGSRNNF